MRLSSRLLFLFALSVLLVTAGCSQSVFVGLPTSTPEDVIVRTVDNPPVPPLGPQLGVRVPELPVTPEPSTIAAGEVVGEESVPSDPPFIWSETENILILGTDRRSESDNWRTDTIMVVGLDRELQRAAVLSIPRDTYLEIPNYGYGRINQIDYIGERILKVEGGGPALLSSVISETLGIPTEHWVRFEMTGFQSVVDAVGGVTIHLDCPFYEPIFNLDTNTWEYFTLPAGDVQMDGETAYWYVRLRLRESDIGRANRQRQFLWALREQTLKTNLLLRFPELWVAFNESFSTDLTLLSMIELARFGIALEPENVRARGITLKELQSHVTERGASVLLINDVERVRAVVNGIWDAPAMVDSNRKDSTRCQEVPNGNPVIAQESATPEPPTEAVGETIPAVMPEAEDGEITAPQAEVVPQSSGG